MSEQDSALSLGEYEKKFNKYSHSAKTTLNFGLGAMTDQMSHQFFQFAAFTFYYAVVGIDLFWLAPSYILFAIWDSINDPIIGVLSDRTVSKYGRRRFWVLISLVPFALCNVFLFFPPAFWPTPVVSEGWNTAYMIFMICMYDLFYSMFSANQTSLFPEMFKSESERGRANRIKNTLTIFGLLLGFALPSFLIKPMAARPDTSPQVAANIPFNYFWVAIIVGALTLVLGFLFFRFGMKEDPSAQTKPEDQPEILKSLKETLSNKTFLIFITANMMNWFVFKLLTAVISLYGIWVLGIGENDFTLTLMLLVAFITAAFLFPVMEKVGKKFGMRTGFIISDTIWILALIPFAFFGEQSQTIAVICMAFVGIGLSGAMYYVDILIGRVIDEDEVNTGIRRQGTYYGVNTLVNRYSTILVVLVIMAVLSGYGWNDYVLGVQGGSDIGNLQTGLKILMTWANIAGILCVILLLIKFPLHGERWKKVQTDLIKMRHDKNFDLK
ncbi:MAG: MFS transporter [Promethearchaeota archaeon]